MSVTATTTTENERGREKGKTSTEPTDTEDLKGAVPKGFFDDKKKEAAVRQTKEEDELGEEWARFQKEIQKEEQESKTLREEDVQDLLRERDHREIEEMEDLWTTVERLESKREELEKLRQNPRQTAGAQKKKEEEEEKEDSDDDGEDLVDDFMNWRSKTTSAAAKRQNGGKH